MKRVFANYCMLESFTVPDETSDKKIYDIICALYEQRGVHSMKEFDDGEYEIIVEKEEEGEQNG